MSAAARWYATQGVPVLPLHWPIPVATGYRCSCGARDCSSPAKHPLGHLTPHGLDDASTDPAVIAEWWRKHPHANIGLRTGIVFDVLDLDGPLGIAAYKAMCDALGGDVEALAIVRTGRADGGRQHYVRPPIARNFTGGRGGIPPGVDCRGVGGYVVAVPSQHITGARYSWVTRWGEGGGAVSWSRAHTWLTTPTGAPTGAHTAIAGPPRAPVAEIGAYALSALTGETDAVRLTPEGARNSQLNDSAFAIGQLVSHGLINEATARGALLDAARAAGLTTHEAERTIASGFAGGAAKPRQALPVQIALDDPPAPDDPTVGEDDQAAAAEDTPPPSDDPLVVEDAPPVAELPAARPVADDQDAASTTPALDDQPPHVDLDAIALAHEIRQLRIRRDARRTLDAQEAAANFPWPAHLPTLADDLAQPDEETPFLIDRIMPAGSNVLLTAQYKTGKTTLVNATACALAEQSPFLDRFDINDHPGRVVIFNFEMATTQYRRWWRDLKCSAPDRITLVHLRGTRLPLLAPITQEWIWSTLQDMRAQTWIVDPFARAFSGSGDENSNSDVGVVLDVLDDIKKQAGCQNLIVATHTGRAEVDEGRERARGATRLDDWADVRWILTRDDHGARYLRATGRDVEIDEEKLAFDTDTRRLTLGGGDRTWERKARIERQVRDFIEANPGCTVRDIHESVTGKRSHIDTARVRLVEARTIRVERDESSGAHRHFPFAPDVLRSRSE
ncbi:bifunctional DNA primase/polymerase [Actinomadura sp. NEAU-AAG7]|uniref:bifunctional DNA primase/polymerase n=1 Tax=Actinomadura sp. NEAU-AAG7 TaxID=2839640 RepID=UPI0020326641|nr:bifunctional DNA primase/polymerase [Actinomadura sp. NEAU-AAG7]MBT2213474.1 bifunctional DNA primase/polymerase [Actinomadura sp. NEAU-AAG7]